MAIRDDYFLRTVEFMGELLRGFLNGGKWDSKEMEALSSEKIGLPYQSILNMDAATLAGLLKANPDTYALKMYLAACLLAHEARERDAEQNRSEAVRFYNKAGYLLKQLEKMEDLSFMDDVKKLTEFVREKTEGDE